MASSTQSQLVKDSLIYDQTLAAPAASTIAQIGTEGDNALVINSNQPCEITRIEIFPALNTTTGLGEDVLRITPVIDGAKFQGGNLIRLRADLDSLFSTDPSLYWGDQSYGVKFNRRPYRMGFSMREIIESGLIRRDPSKVLLNTTLKVKEKGTVDVEYETGSTAVTGTMRVRMWADRFMTGTIADNYVKSVYHPESPGIPIFFADHKTGRNFQSVIGVDYNGYRSDWSKLIGGNDIHLRDGVSFKRFNYWAFNTNATTPSVQYQMSSSNPSNVTGLVNNMDINVDDKTLYVVKGIGVNDYSGNLRYLRINANTQEVLQGRIDNKVNAYQFGRQTAPGASVGIQSHKFYSLPMLEDGVLGHNEELQVTLQDSGTAVGAGGFQAGALVVWDGWIIQDRNLEMDRANFLTGAVGGPRGF